MKKKKLNLFLNLVTICLCLCAIAIGVYSVKNASLSVTGTIGFTANNCTVKITATTTSADEANSKMVTSTAKSITLGAKDTTGSTETDQILTTNTGSLDFGNLLFSDLIDGGDVITISLKIQNLSVFKITANTPAPTLATAVSGVTCETTDSKFDLDANASKDVTMTITLADIANASSITSNAFTMALSFERYIPIKVQTATNFREYTSTTEYEEVSRSYVEMGSVTVDSEIKNLRWFIFAKGDKDGSNMEAVTGTVDTDSNGYLTSGTYWFISEYALGNQAFKSDKSSNEYITSDIKDYLNGTYLTEYNILTSEVYSKISPRALTDVNIDTEDQNLWLLSLEELSYLNGSEVSIDDIYPNLIATNWKGIYSIDWWLRTPYGSDVESACCVFGGGVCDAPSSAYEVDHCNGVRPAFQITI